MTRPLRIVFMGTPGFSVPSLQRLFLNPDHKIVCVYTQPPRPSGRGHHLLPSPIHQWAKDQGIEVRTPTTLKTLEEQEKFFALQADLAIVVAYGLMLPLPILEGPRFGCVNVHASLLPRWRGAAPIQRAIEAGDTETGITLMRMDQGLDTGPMIKKAFLPILPETTAQILHDSLSLLGADLLDEALPSYIDGALIPVPQPEEGVTYARKISKEEGKVDWSCPADVILRKIRALTPFPGVWFLRDGVRTKIHDASIILESHRENPGTVMDDQGVIACGENLLRLLILQKEGGKPLPLKEFLRGNCLPKGVELPS